MNPALPARSSWLRCWSAMPRADILATAAAVQDPGWRVRHRQVPRAGLAMLQLRECNQGQRFLLGELPLAVAEVAIAVDGAAEIAGAAQVLADDAELAGALAVLDAVLAHGLDRAGAAAALLERGRQRCRTMDAHRAAMLQRTAVAFSRLELTDDDHA